MQLPLGVFGVAVATTALTHLSRDAARGTGEVRDASARAAQVPFLNVPSAVGLALLGARSSAHLPARPVLPHARRDGARAVCYAVGLSAYSA